MRADGELHLCHVFSDKKYLCLTNPDDLCIAVLSEEGRGEEFALKNAERLALLWNMAECLGWKTEDIERRMYEIEEI